MNLVRTLVSHLHVGRTHNAEHKMSEQCVFVHPECLVPLQIVDQNVILIKIVHQIEPVFNKDVRILASDLVVLTQYVMCITINQFALVLMDMKEILTLVATFAKVSERFLFRLSVFWLLYIYMCFFIFQNFVL